MAEKNKGGKDERTPEEKRAHSDLLQAGIGYYNISSIGDTSDIPRQAAGLEHYAKSQGLDSERDLNGLPRHVGLFGQLVPKEQEGSEKALLEITEKHFKYAVGCLGGEKAVGLAARLETSAEELALEETLLNPESKLEDVQKDFSAIYEPSSLVSHYIALNTNKEEVANAAYGALQRSTGRRQSKYIHTVKDKKSDGHKIIYHAQDAKTYILENMDGANEKVAKEVKLNIGSHLAHARIAKEVEKAQQQNS